MKIAINNSCNSKCPYCFAGNMGIDSKSNMTYENFKKILDLMIKNNDNYLVVLGGEPTIHPEFRKFLKLIKQYSIANSWDISFLSNGVKLGDFVDDIPVLSSFLININSPNTLGGQKNYESLIVSLTKLSDKLKIFKEQKVVLGCNLCYEIDDYDFYWNIVDKFNCGKLRVSVASPQNNEYLYDRDSYFKIMKEKFLNFMHEAIKRKCDVGLDCSQIPPCYFSSVELAMIDRYCENSYKMMGKCADTILQVMPDMSYSCCFGDEDFENSKKYIDENEKFKDIVDAVIQKRQSRLKDRYIEKCEGCELKELGWCAAGCYGFKDAIKVEGGRENGE